MKGTNLRLISYVLSLLTMLITDIVSLPSHSLLYSRSGVWIVPLFWFQLPENTGSSSDEEAEEEDVEVALKKEVAQLKASGTKQQRRFQAMESGANNVIFIRTQNLGKHLTETTVSALSLKCYVTIMFILLCPRIWQVGSSHPVGSPHNQEEEVQSDSKDATSEKIKSYLHDTHNVERCYDIGASSFWRLLFISLRCSLS